METSQTLSYLEVFEGRAYQNGIYIVGGLKEATAQS